MYKVDPSQSQFVDMNMQNTILNTLHMQCVHVVKPYLQAKSKYYNEEVHAKKWPFWTAQNDSLRKIVYGTYKGKTLPIPFVNAIHMIKNDAFRSFFTQRIIVYHNAISAPSPPNTMERDGSTLLGQASTKLEKKNFEKIDVTIPAILVAESMPIGIPPAPIAAHPPVQDVVPDAVHAAPPPACEAASDSASKEVQKGL
jgi:hypothetical protein